MAAVVRLPGLFLKLTTSGTNVQVFGLALVPRMVIILQISIRGCLAATALLGWARQE